MTEVLPTIGLTLLVFSAVSVAIHGVLWLRSQRNWTDISDSEDAPDGVGKSVRLLLPSRSYSVAHRGRRFRGLAADGTELPIRDHVGDAVGDCWAHFVGHRPGAANVSSSSSSDTGSLHTA